MDTVDALLADLNDVICEMQDEKAEPVFSSPQTFHETFSPKTNDYAHLAPRDWTLSSIASLPDAFGGWLHRASYSFIKTRTMKRKYVVLANCSLYIFASDACSSVFEESFPVNPQTSVRVCEKGVYAIQFMSTEANQEKKLIVEFQCFDKDEMVVWLECFRDAIDEAKNGRIPLDPQSFRSGSIQRTSDPTGSIARTSTTNSHKSNEIVDSYSRYDTGYEDSSPRSNSSQRPTQNQFFDVPQRSNTVSSSNTSTGVSNFFMAVESVGSPKMSVKSAPGNSTKGLFSSNKSVNNNKSKAKEDKKKKELNSQLEFFASNFG